MNSTTASESRGVHGFRRMCIPFLQLIKLLVLPFRFAWLLVVWLRLRRGAMKVSS